jgi:hypothetical protein
MKTLNVIFFLFFCHVFGESTQNFTHRAGQERTNLSLRCPGEDKETEREREIVSARACAYILISSSSSSSRLERERFSQILLLLFLLLKHASAGKVRKKKRIGERSPPREKETQREREGDFIDSFLRWSSR